MTNEKEINEQRYCDLAAAQIPTKYIAKYLGISRDCLQNWMRERGYTSSYRTGRTKLDVLWHDMYYAGATDREIADETDTCVGTIIAWRRKNVYPPNKTLKLVERMEMYNNGATDREISEATGESIAVICEWRHKVGLKVNRSKSKSTILAPKMRRLYNLGLSDQKIADKCGVSRRSVSEWRYANNIEANLYRRRVNGSKQTSDNTE